MTTPAETLRILVVDDDQVDRMAVRRALLSGGVGAEVREAGDATEALALLRAEEFDCVLLDYQLPSGDGIGVLRAAREAGVRAPFIVLTGQSDVQVAAELMKEGAADYLTKSSLTPERLERAIRSTLRVHQAELEAAEAKEALRVSEERYRYATRATNDAIWDWDLVTNEVFWSEAISSVFGYPPEEVGLSAEWWRSHIHPDDRDRVVKGLHAAIDGGAEVWLDEFRYQRADASFAYIIDSGYVLRDGEGSAVRMIGSMADITRRKAAEEERERAVMARSRFYATMSHELRTPFNAILGYTDLILAGIYGELNQKQRETLERSQRATRHLLELINDVLDFSKLEAGKMDLQLEPVSVPELVEDLLGTVGPLAEERGCELLMAAHDCADRIVTDPKRLRQILMNLLSNAIKYGQGSPVTVRCIAAPGPLVAIEVEDHGPGIAPADLPRVFEEYVQLPSANAGGTGLGLAISRRLAELLGGKLEAESTVGIGTIFRLTISDAGAPGGEAAVASPGEIHVPR